MIDADNPVSGDSTPDDDTEVSLSEAAQAVMDVLVECHGNLEAVRHRLNGDEIDVDMDSSELPSPREQVLHIAAQLESCAGALRDAERE
ncbi:hypothetical protein [Salinibacter ruber]|uniref:Uncharacterized protein n=1 Tax=Salinibacter ruber TaxID=146919 RepID=A0A9X2QAP1_9BACT|nr:hypothetical protein [Salinibacter ruber]MCS3662008.1 hypothetical protein [Salinibacter ruber]MCS3711803.1 hypothetical protein [Salinibacter ruber]MCS4142646.1 hypothetical protein [Salinibacter ruber]